MGTGTPCVRVCKLNPEKLYCTGCYRTLQEIENWLGYTDLERQQITKLLEERKKTLTL